MGEDRASNVGGRHVDSAQEDTTGLSEKALRLRAKAQRAAEARKTEDAEYAPAPERTSTEREGQSHRRIPSECS